MAEFILKDRYGKEKTFDHDKIFVQGTDGELVQFTEGTGDTPAVVQPLEVTENGTYTAPDGVDGYSPVTVNVDPTKITIFKEKEMVGFALDNQLGYLKEEYPPSFTPTVGEKYSVAWDGVVYDNLAVTDASAVVSGAVYIGNGSAYGLPGNNEPFAILYMYGALGYCAFDDSSESHTIGVWKKVVQEISLQDKTITENGTYTADSGYDGLGSVTVNVKGGGGGLPAGGYWKPEISCRPTSYDSHMFVYNGKRYMYALSAYNSTKYDIYLLEDDVYTKVATEVSDKKAHTGDTVEFNGVLHIFFDDGYGSKTYHYVWNGGSSLSSLSNPPYPCMYNGQFVMDNNLFIKTKNNGFYKWVADSDTWESVVVTNCPNTSYENVVVIGRNVYIVGQNKIYEVDFDNKTCTTIETGLPNGVSGRGYSVAHNGYIYYHTSASYLNVFCGVYKYDVKNKTTELVAGLHSGSVSLYVYNNRIYAHEKGHFHQALYEVTE